MRAATPVRPLHVTAMAACFAAALFAAPASAQDYPARPIRMVVGLPAGGTTDIMGRIVAAKLAERLGQQVVVDNRPGASGIIGIEIVVRSQPDGYTLLMAGGSFGTVNAMYPKAPFHVAKDLAPVAFVGNSPYVLVVQPSVPAKTLTELAAYSKTRPGTLNFAGSAPGSLQHLGGELLKRTVGIDMMYVPYKGTGALMPDLLGGRLHVAIDNVLVLVPHMKSGVLRGLGVTGAKRSVVVPDLPTLAESGAPGFDAVGWFGVFAAARTPAPVVAKLHSEIAAFMKDPDVRDRLLAQGAEPNPGSPEELRRYLARQIETWGKVIRDAKVKVE